MLEHLHKSREFASALAKMLEARFIDVLTTVFLLECVRRHHLDHLAVMLRAPGDSKYVKGPVDRSAINFAKCRYDIVHLEKPFRVGQPVRRRPF